MGKIANMFRKLSCKRCTRETLFLTALSLFVASRLIEASALFQLPNMVYKVVTLLACGILVLEYFFQQHTKKEVFVDVLCLIGLSVLTVMGAPVFLVASFLVFKGIKGVELKKAIKYDIIIKIGFLAIHFFAAIVFICVGYSINVDGGTKGLLGTMLFSNANTVGLLGVWLAIEMLYLKGEKKKIIDYIIPALIVMVLFILVGSRTSVIIFGLYIILEIVKNDSFLNVLQKMIFPVLTILSFIIVQMPTDTALFDAANKALSGRLSHSIVAYESAGMHFLPNSLLPDFFTSQEKVSKLTVDNFYVRGFIQYGVVSLIIYYLQYALVPKKSKKEVKRISILMNIYLFSELTVAFAGFFIPNIIVADSIQNKERKK